MYNLNCLHVIITIITIIIKFLISFSQECVGYSASSDRSHIDSIASECVIPDITQSVKSDQGEVFEFKVYVRVNGTINVGFLRLNEQRSAYK